MKGPGGFHRGGFQLAAAVLLFGSQDNDGCGTSHSNDAQNIKDHGTMVTGFGQVKATGVHNGQGSFGVLAAVVLQHIDSFAVNGCGSGQQVVLQMDLGHILQIAGIIDDGGIPRVILDQTQNIGFIDVAQFSGFLLGNDDFDIVLQQSVAIIGADLGDGVSVIFQTLDDDLAG